MSNQPKSKESNTTTGTALSYSTPNPLGYITVRLGGKKVGQIRPRQGGFRYYPKGSASPGEWFASNEGNSGVASRLRCSGPGASKSLGPHFSY